MLEKSPLPPAISAWAPPSKSLIWGLMALAFSLSSSTAKGQERSVPRPIPVTTPILPDLQLQKYEANVQIKDLIATTTLKLVFRNPEPQQREGTFLLPLSPESSPSNFSIALDGQKLVGEVLDHQQARSIYESIVRRRRDPGLLEYVGYGLFRASLFPIGPHAEVPVEVSFTEALDRHGQGLSRIFHPLKSLSEKAVPKASHVITIEIDSAIPLKLLYSPTHDIDVSQDNPHHALVGFEAQGRQRQDFEFYLARSAKEFALIEQSYRRPGQDGFFALTLSPDWDSQQAKPEPQDIVFVVDTSGSMQGAKIEQTKKALRYCLQSLAPHDRFNIVDFSTTSRAFADSLIEASKPHIDAALEYIDSRQASGGTHISEALARALAMSAPQDPDMPQRLFQVLFLTDGLPTVGETDPHKLLATLHLKEQKGRIFAMGIGDDVNTFLLDKLCQDGRGSRDYVGGTEDLELKISSLYEQIAKPALTDIQLDYGELQVYDTFPRVLPDIFYGREVMIVGRYRGQGRQTITLSGTKGGEVLRFQEALDFDRVSMDRAYLPSVWASRKVGYLLDQIRLAGSSSELVDEVIALGKSYGIVTPYTSHLAVEDEQLTQFSALGSDRGVDDFLGWVQELGEKDSADNLLALGNVSQGRAEEASGETAVAGSRYVRELSRSKRAFTPPSDTTLKRGVTGNATQWVHGRMFCLVGGVWVDSSLTGEEKQNADIISSFSEEYFQWLREHPEWEACFALGANVIFKADESVIHLRE